MTIAFYKGLTRNPEIGNTQVCVLPNIWRLGRVRDTEIGVNVSNEMLMGYSFYRFWVIKRKLNRGGGLVKLPHHTQIRVNNYIYISTGLFLFEIWLSREQGVNNLKLLKFKGTLMQI